MKLSASICGSVSVKFRGHFLWWSWDKTESEELNYSVGLANINTALPIPDTYRSLQLPGPYDLRLEVKPLTGDIIAVYAGVVPDGTNVYLYEQHLSFSVSDILKGRAIPVRLRIVNYRGIDCDVLINLVFS